MEWPFREQRTFPFSGQSILIPSFPQVSHSHPTGRDGSSFCPYCFLHLAGQDMHPETQPANGLPQALRCFQTRLVPSRHTWASPRPAADSEALPCFLALLLSLWKGCGHGESRC